MSRFKVASMHEGIHGPVAPFVSSLVQRINPCCSQSLFESFFIGFLFQRPTIDFSQVATNESMRTTILCTIQNDARVHGSGKVWIGFNFLATHGHFQRLGSSIFLRDATGCGLEITVRRTDTVIATHDSLWCLERVLGVCLCRETKTMKPPWIFFVSLPKTRFLDFISRVCTAFQSPVRYVSFIQKKLTLHSCNHTY